MLGKFNSRKFDTKGFIISTQDPVLEPGQGCKLLKMSFLAIYIVLYLSLETQGLFYGWKAQ